MLRLPSPAPRPQSLAFDGTLLWMGSLETGRLYAIDRRQWTVREEAAAPGLPYGMTVVGDELRVLCGETPDDHRVIRRFVPGHGFKSEGAIPVPDDTGSQLAYDGDRLYVSQFYKRRVLSLDDRGTVGSVLGVPHDICGVVVVAGRFFLVTTDDEESEDYWLTCIDARGPTPQVSDVAHISFPARGLAFDGTNFWTNHRANDEIVAFAQPA
jgi:hypothetical protein